MGLTAKDPALLLLGIVILVAVDCMHLLLLLQRQTVLYNQAFGLYWSNQIIKTVNFHQSNAITTVRMYVLLVVVFQLGVLGPILLLCGKSKKKEPSRSLPPKPAAPPTETGDGKERPYENVSAEEMHVNKLFFS